MKKRRKSMTKEERNEIIKACKKFAESFWEDYYYGQCPELKAWDFIDWVDELYSGLNKIGELEGAPTTLEEVLRMANQEEEEFDD
jgi:hypothetical protein